MKLRILHSISDATSLSNHSEHLFSALDALHGGRASCSDCNFSLNPKISPIIPPMPELRYGMEAALHDAPDPEDAARVFAQPVEEGQMRVNLARLQLRFALGVLLDSMASLDIAEAIAHSGQHCVRPMHKSAVILTGGCT
jgi:hypothetical protein